MHENWIHRLSPAQLLLFFYFIAIVLSTVILSLPVVYQDGVELPFIDILFTAVSALSVTGLSTISIGESLSTTGVILLTFILQLGAVGVMSVSTFIWLLLGKKIGLSERRLIMQDQNQTTFGGMVDLIKQILYVVLAIELVGFFILGTYFIRYFPTLLEAYYNGYFTTVSAITNGGFSLSNESMAMFKDDYFVQFIVMLLVIFGAIGFPVLIEVKQFILKRRKKKRRFRFSLFTKLTTSTFTVLILLGAAFICLIDLNGFFNEKNGMKSYSSHCFNQ